MLHDNFEQNDLENRFAHLNHSEFDGTTSSTSSHQLLMTSATRHLSMANTGSDQSEYDLSPSNTIQCSPFASSSFGYRDGGSSSSLDTAKNVCGICGDRASGKHYGVYSCEGCKGFFKRTVRKELQYACRDQKQCIIDKRQRNRCQYCRYMKCLTLGMRREAVQEERQKAREKVEIKVESPSPAVTDGDYIPVKLILEAELAANGGTDSTGVLTEFAEPVDIGDDTEGSTVMCEAVDRQLLTLVEWARRIPYFIELPLVDQVALLRSGWNELLIAAFAYQSTATEDSILLARGLHVYRNNAHQAGIGIIFDRVLAELVSKMRELAMDQTELGCLRTTVLYNPDAQGLSCRERVEALREKVYAALEAYCRQSHPEQTNRFAKLLLRLPALRSIGLKCAHPLFVHRLLGDTPVDSFLMDLLENYQQLQQQ